MDKDFMLTYYDKIVRPILDGADEDTSLPAGCL